MDLKVFLPLVFFTTVASTAPKEEEFYVHNHSDDYVDYEYDVEPRNKQTDAPTSAATNKPAASYEVTEIVDDIPNNATYTGPIVANFTIKLPHNNATLVESNTNTINNNKNEDLDKDGIDNFFNEFGGTDHHSNKVNKNLRKNSISIFHVNAEFDDDKPTIQNININKLPNIGIFNVKEHVNRFKHGVINHIHNVNNKEVYSEVNHGFLVPNVIAGPIAFFNKIHKKGSAVATKLHDVIFGHFDDY